MMTPLKRGGVTDKALSPIYLHKVDFKEKNSS